MKISKFLTLTSLASVLSLLLACAAEPEPKESDEPQSPHISNVLLITLDAVRPDRLGCYGYQQARTPFLDKLARNGVLFEQAFAQSPLTLPSHATIMTGLFPAEHSLLENGRHVLPEDIPTLAEIFRNKGFATGAFIGGAFLDEYYGLGRGFDTYKDQITAGKMLNEQWMTEPGEQVTGNALDWLKKHVPRQAADGENSSQSKPGFFCWVNLADARPAEYLSAKEGKDLDETYNQQIALLDRQVGRLLEFLTEANLLEKTVVVVVSPSAEALSEHCEHGRGLFLYSSTLHVPLIISAPQRLGSGKKVSSLVSLVNLLPTILELNGWQGAAGHKPDVQTVSLVRASFLPITPPADIWPSSSYARTDYPLNRFRWISLRSLTTTDWHYIDAPMPELYDRKSDPSQTKNLAATNPEQVASLQETLSELENSLTARQPVQPKLPSEAREIIQGLSQLPQEYITEGLSRSQSQPDPKDMIGAYQAYWAGVLLLENKKYSQALEQLTAADAHSPGSPYILLALSRAQQHAGKLEQAYRSGRTAAAIDPTNPALLSQMVTVLSAMQKWPQAIIYCQASLALKSIQAETLVDLAVAYWAQRESLSAISSLQKALAVRPGYTDAHYNLAVLLAEEGRKKQAIPHFRAVVQKQPDFTEAILRWAVLLLEQGRFSEAARRLERVLELDPDRIDARYQLATILVMQNKQDQAITHYEKALENAEGIFRAQIKQDLGRALLARGKYSDAIAHLSEAVSIEPSLGWAHCWLGQALQATGDKDQALLEFKLALKYSPNFLPALAPLSELTLQRSLNLAKDSRFAPAIALLKEVRELLPEDPAIANALARYLATCPKDELRDGNLSVSLAEQAVRATGQRKPEYLDTLAAAYAERGKYSKAVETARKAMTAASQQGRDEFVAELDARAKLYESGKPYREKPY